jgi:hypothetical protein
VAESDFTVLDYEDGIQVPGNVFAEPVNEYWALMCLKQGLEYLYHQISQYDQMVQTRVNSDGNGRVTILFNHPVFAGVPMRLLTCAFHWYAVSACQYVRTVGAIAYRQDSNRPLPDKYVESVIPEVLAFRNKVAAHFAGLTLDRRDNEAERLASVMPQLGFEDDSFCVGAFTVRTVRDGEVSDSKSIKVWSIRRVHGELQHRYWPAGVGSALESS